MSRKTRPQQVVWIVSEMCASKPWDTNEAWSPRAAFTTEELAKRYLSDAHDDETPMRVESFSIPLFAAPLGSESAGKE